jgi:hypothetical protein
MKTSLEIGLSAILLVQALAFAAQAQTVAPPPAAPPPRGATAAAIQAQLDARGPAGRIGGEEAAAIYKNYLAGIGKPLVPTINGPSSNSQDSAGHGGGYQ